MKSFLSILCLATHFSFWKENTMNSFLCLFSQILTAYTIMYYYIFLTSCLSKLKNKVYYAQFFAFLTYMFGRWSHILFFINTEYRYLIIFIHCYLFYHSPADGQLAYLQSFIVTRNTVNKILAPRSFQMCACTLNSKKQSSGIKEKQNFGVKKYQHLTC